MPIITAITPQKRNKARVNIFLDEKFAFGLSMQTAANLTVGTEFTPELAQIINTKEELENARQQAFRLIAMRPRSITEVRRRLIQRKHEDEVIEQTLTYLQEKGYLDDLAFAKYWLDQRETFKPRGARAIQQELGQKGVNREIIQTVLIDFDELDNAQRAANSRVHQWATLPQPQFQKKMSGFLKRRGFAYDTVRQVTNESWEALEEEGIL